MIAAALPVSYHSDFMKSKLFIPALFIVATVFFVISGSDFVESWKSFFVGALFTLAALDVGKELFK